MSGGTVAWGVSLNDDAFDRTIFKKEGKMKTNEIIVIVKDFFMQTEATKVYLFGSRSREEEQENSDVDLLVYFPDDINLLKIAKYKGLLEKKIHQKIDLLTPESISERILPYIQKEMKLIYER
jgi:predicted nucleotidyltransferase